MPPFGGFAGALQLVGDPMVDPEPSEEIIDLIL